MAAPVPDLTGRVFVAVRWPAGALGGVHAAAPGDAALVDVDGTLLVWIVAASVLVGISEELMFCGNIVVCLRRAALPEERVWLLSSLFFVHRHLHAARGHRHH